MKTSELVLDKDREMYYDSKELGTKIRISLSDDLDAYYDDDLPDALSGPDRGIRQ